MCSNKPLFVVISSERGERYSSEAAQVIVDYLFLSRDIVRIQAWTDVRNLASGFSEDIGEDRFQEGTV